MRLAVNSGVPHNGGLRGWIWRSRRLLLGVVGAGLLLAVASALTVSRLEESDSFCITCHTAPEEAYFNRAQAVLAAAEAQDLASAHYTLIETGAKCIDCHNGDGGVAHRALAIALGARDSLVFVSGQADPSLEKAENSIAIPDLLNAACVKCHADTLLVVGFENHFHNKLPDAYTAWKAGGRLTTPPGHPNLDTSSLKQYETAVRCVDCHRGHVTVELGEAVMYLDQNGVVFPACIQCHREVGHGPLELLGP